MSAGNLYVPGSSRVQEFSTAGASIRTFDEGGSPHGIATEPTSGNLYVTDPAKHRVAEFSSEGSAIATFGSAGSGSGELSEPKGVAMGSSGIAYVADTGNQRLEEWVLP
jgi:DNA-binding beta-propeller fold protein YncE